MNRVIVLILMLLPITVLATETTDDTTYMDDSAASYDEGTVDTGNSGYNESDYNSGYDQGYDGDLSTSNAGSLSLNGVGSCTQGSSGSPNLSLSTTRNYGGERVTGTIGAKLSIPIGKSVQNIDCTEIVAAATKVATAEARKRAAQAEADELAAKLKALKLKLEEARILAEIKKLEQE